MIEHGVCIYCANLYDTIILEKADTILERRMKRVKSMNDNELEKVTGGDIPIDIACETIVIRQDSKGNPTHFQNARSGTPIEGAVWHYVCPHCGRLLHQGALGRMYCDPCDEGWFPNFSIEPVSGFYPGCE